MPTLDAVTVSPQMRDFDKLCRSDDLSLIALKEKVSLLDESDIKHITDYGSCFHRACLNSKVTLEIIEYLLDVFPRVASIASVVDLPDKLNMDVYPLHCACYNKDCPSSVIRLLSERYPLALEQLCTVGVGIHDYGYHIPGLPLHYYLARNCNVDIDTVKVMVESYPTSLTISDEESACFPIHALLLNWRSTDVLHEILTYLIEIEPSSVRMLDRYGNTLLHLACRTKNTLDIVQLLYNTWPETIRTSDSDGILPIHNLCCNRMVDNTDSLATLRFMLNVDPTLVRGRDIDGELPIHRAVYNMSFEFCRVLIDEYPESLKVRTTSDGSLPVHVACESSNACRDDQVDTIQYMLEIYPESINTRNRYGLLPIHLAATCGKSKVIELLLKHDPSAATKSTNQPPHEVDSPPPRLPLHLVCSEHHGDYFDAVKVLYDAYPEAIHKLDGDISIPHLVRETYHLIMRGGTVRQV